MALPLRSASALAGNIRLAEASRTLAGSVQHHYAEATGRMRAALWAAEDLRSASADEAAEADRDLSEREATLRQAVALVGMV